MKKLAKSFLVIFLLASFVVLNACSNDENEDTDDEEIYITVDFDSNGGSLVSSIVTLDLSSIELPNNPTKDGYNFEGWYWDNHTFTDPLVLSSLNDRNLSDHVTVYAKWIEELAILNMVMVGELETQYTVPIGTSGQAIVQGGFLMATTETTYKLWYEVRIWAEDNGYHFQNKGREGSHGGTGVAPTSAKLNPVTNVSWFDTLVWLNALSEYYEVEPIYRDANHQIIRDSRNVNKNVLSELIIENHNGYRLPTNHEWEMAARWRESDGNDAIYVGNRYWTPWNYASGAEGPTRDPIDITATRAVAWFSGASGGNVSRMVSLLSPNHLGIYDMSGNVWEWTSARNSFGDGIARGSSYLDDIDYMAIGFANQFTTDPLSTWNMIGFRIVKNP